jgi:Stage II sporulation protein E (SpoIIE)
MGEDEQALDAVAAQVVTELMARSHLVPPDDVAGALAETAKPLGVLAVRIWLADLQQQYLRALPERTAQLPPPQAVDTTIAGRAYRTVQTFHNPANGQHGHRVWLPLLDGSERLGVLELTVTEVNEAMLARYRMLASLAGLMVASKSIYSDMYAQLRRNREMALQAEMVWAFLAPRTFATDRVLVAATLEPAYEVGGDAFDYSLIGDRLHVSLFDAAGHDLAAGLLASVAMASCRSTRRAGGTLRDVVARADHAIARQFSHSRFVTALLCDLDISSGQFSWIPCGHPPPLLIRNNKVIKELSRTPQLPLGLAGIRTLPPQYPHGTAPLAEDGSPAATERLEPGDRVLLYTDGVIEGRAADGSSFGTERLSDFIIRHSYAGIPAPETLRRLTRAISEFQHGRLRDDATIVMVEWLPSHPRRQANAQPS